jgi:hypothetical protein
MHQKCIASEHALAYASNSRPSLIEGEWERGMTIEPFAIDLTDADETLNPAWRICLGRIYPVEMNAEVRDIGIVAERDRARLLICHRNQFREKAAEKE